MRRALERQAADGACRCLPGLPGRHDAREPHERLECTPVEAHRAGARTRLRRGREHGGARCLQADVARSPRAQVRQPTPHPHQCGPALRLEARQAEGAAVHPEGEGAEEGAGVVLGAGTGSAAGRHVRASATLVPVLLPVRATGARSMPSPASRSGTFPRSWSSTGPPSAARRPGRPRSSRARTTRRWCSACPRT